MMPDPQFPPASGIYGRSVYETSLPPVVVAL